MLIQFDPHLTIHVTAHVFEVVVMSRILVLQVKWIEAKVRKKTTGVSTHLSACHSGKCVAPL